MPNKVILNQGFVDVKSFDLEMCLRLAQIHSVSLIHQLHNTEPNSFTLWDLNQKLGQKMSTFTFTFTPIYSQFLRDFIKNESSSYTLHIFNNLTLLVHTCIVRIFDELLF